MAALPPPPAWELIDVLEQLPLPELQEGFCRPYDRCDMLQARGKLPSEWLDQPSPTPKLRQACRSARNLANKLSRTVVLRQREASATLLADQAAFIERLERPELLVLSDASDNADVRTWDDPPPPLESTTIATTLELASTQGPLPLLSLRLCSFGGCTAASGAAVHTACPLLQHVQLQLHALDPNFFTPWGGCLLLTQVEIWEDDTKHPVDSVVVPALVEALAALPGLTHLTLSAIVTCDVVTHLPLLTRLQALHVSGLEVCGQSAGAVLVGQALGSMTHLTALCVPCWRKDTGSAAINLIVSQLGALSHLRTLSFGDTLSRHHTQVLHYAAFSVVCSLSALTHLGCCPTSRMVAAAAGHLPALRRLQIFGAAELEDVAATLLPLTPLPQLLSVKFAVRLQEDADATTTAVQPVVEALANAPRLGGVELSLTRDIDAPFASFRVACALLLGPLTSMLTSLRLGHLRAGGLQGALPTIYAATRLQVLELHDCDAAEQWDAMSGQEMAAWRRVCFFDHRASLMWASRSAAEAAHVQSLSVIVSTRKDPTWRHGF